jgi:hypothetical protein
VTVPPDPGFQGYPPPPGPPPYGPPPSGPPHYGPPHYGPPPYGPPSGGLYPPPPPPLPYQGTADQPYYSSPPKKSSKKWWLIGGISIVLLLLVVVVVGFIAVGASGSHRKTATDVAVGDCISKIPDGNKVMSVKTVSCDQPHGGEVFAVLMMPDGDYPGQSAVEAYHEKCSPALAAYSPAAMTDDSVQLYVLYPTADTWSNGDRAVTCIATLDPPRAGSLKG